MISSKLDKPVVGGLLLAAGSSSRLGQSKQLVEFNHQPLLSHTLETLLSSRLDHTLTVLGARFQEHLPVIEHLATSTCVNEAWEKGMGHSLKFGMLRLLETQPTLDGVLIAVCDQPFLTTTHLNGLLDLFTYNSQSIVASEYQGVQGVPAIFPKRYFQDLLSIGDQSGAKKILTAHADRPILRHLEKGEIDIDTREDLDHLR
ncbi:MAG: nucleotidyltransferase family protein [Marinoscillum sp.]|uniref:nucleotidyltransferase family protein n=1 Tax=Marinoscillum sp. TaxID=2024838 RepID=UPI0032F95FEB